jgi:predicted GNAT family acetyltransferase
MRLRTFTAAAVFLDAVGPTLLAHEAENSLLLGIALRLADGHNYGAEAPFLACVEDDDGRLSVIALRTPPHNLILCAVVGRVDALALVADCLVDAGATLPGLHGRVDVADAFAVLWQKKTDVVPRIGMEQRLYRLTEVARPANVRGGARWGTRGEASLLTAWADAFIDEAVPNDPKPDVRAMVERAIEGQALLVWDDGRTVSMCARSRPTPHGASVNLVYTPPALRGHGYASACVAELSVRILDSGKAFCTLFTDLANPTSNAIYQRIGYQPLCDFRELRFSSPRPKPRAVI